MSTAPALPRILIAATALMWAGIIIGLAYIGSLARFNTPGLALPIAFQEGVVAFGMLQKVNWGALLLLGVLCCLAQSRRAWGAWVLLIGMELFMDTVLLPALAARAALHLAAAPLPPSTWHHAGYGITEIARLLTLFTLAFVMLRVTLRASERAGAAT